MSLILKLLALQGTNTAATGTFVDGVGALLRARTVSQNGGELGTFTSATRPTYTQVLELMDQAAKDLDTEIGTDSIAFPRLASVKPLADSLLKLRTAMLIELSFFPEQVAQGRSAYDAYERMYDKRLPKLVKAVAEAGAGDDPGPADDQLKPIYGFPAARTPPTRQEVIDRWISGGWR